MSRAKPAKPKEPAPLVHVKDPGRPRYCKFCGSTEHDAAVVTEPELGIIACPLVKARKGSENQIGNGQTYTWYVLPPLHEWHATKHKITDYDNHIPRIGMQGIESAHESTGPRYGKRKAQLPHMGEAESEQYTPPKQRQRRGK